jgi:hypothetical protein
MMKRFEQLASPKKSSFGKCGRHEPRRTKEDDHVKKQKVETARGISRVHLEELPY